MARYTSHTSSNGPTYLHHLVWLDNTLDDPDNEGNIDRLREIDETTRTFTDRKKCLAYLNELNERNTKSYVMFIVSRALCEKVIPKIADHSCILAIFIFCSESERNNQLESDMVTICTNIDMLVYRIVSCIGRDTSSMDYKLMSMPNTTEAGK